MVIVINLVRRFRSMTLMRFPTTLGEWGSQNEEATHRRADYQADRGVRGQREDICRQLSVSTDTFYNWRSKYLGLEVSEAKRIKALVAENNKVKKLLAERLHLKNRRKDKLKRRRMPLVVPLGTDVRMSMGFVSDQLSNGRRFRVLDVQDDYSKELVGQLVSYSISGHQVARFLDQLIEQISAPSQITCANETKFTDKAMFFWQTESGVRLEFIWPGKPTQNSFVESLSGRFRLECLISAASERSKVPAKS